MEESCYSEDLFFGIQTEKESLWTKRELAEFLNVGVKTIDKWVCSKSIPFLKLGRSVRFRRREVELWLQQRSH